VLERNVKLQAQLVDDLLDISRILSGRLHLDAHRAALPGIVQAALAGGRAAAESKGLTLASSVDVDLPAVRADSARLQQVVDSLIASAVKATPAGGRIDVAVTRVDRGAEIRITDTGR